MLQKIANSLVHGNFRTKLFLWSVIALGTAALILLAAALALGMPALGAGAAGFGFVGLVTSQSVSLKDLEKPHKKKTSKSKVKEPADRSKGQSSDSFKEQENGERQLNGRTGPMEFVFNWSDKQSPSILAVGDGRHTNDT